MDRAYLKNLIDKNCNFKKATILFGARQVGKSTLLKQFLTKKQKEKKTYKLINADSYYDRDYFNNTNKISLLNELTQYDYVAIDEAQKLEDIDLFIKNFIDYKESDSHLILTGSSSIGIKDSIKESNVGRKTEIEIFAPAIFEIYHEEKKAKTFLEDRLVYGSYPEISLSEEALTTDKKADLLRTIVNDYLFKDIFAIDGLKNARKIENLAMLIAYRVGSELNLNSLAADLQLNRATIEKYLELMEKSFLIFRLDSYSNENALLKGHTISGNSRGGNSLKKQKKYYFFDNGIRNALINNFSNLAHRDDLGALWENFIIAEKVKINKYSNPTLKSYFWKAKANLAKQEIDLVEEIGDGNLNHLYAYELKYTKDESQIRVPSQWEREVPLANFCVINKNNFFEFLKFI